MIALGVDISTRKIALAGITDRGVIHTHCAHVQGGLAGARRLCVMRTVLTSSLAAERWQDTVVAVVEVAWPGFVLLSATAVVMEATQASLPGTIVMEVQAASWKRETVGRGTAPKQDCLTYAQGLGYDGTDQDLADAVCMASAAWGRWNRDIGEAA